MASNNVVKALIGTAVVALSVTFMPNVNVNAEIELIDSTHSFINSVDSEIDVDNLVDVTELFEIEYNAPEGLAIAMVESKLNIRKGPGTSYEKVGYLKKNGACIVLDYTSDGWVHIKSGKIEGYVDVSYLITEEEAAEYSKAVVAVYATVKCDSLNVRSDATVSSSKLNSIKKGSSYKVLDDAVADKKGDKYTWVKIALNDDATSIGYVSSDYVDIAYDFEWAYPASPYGDVSQLRINICDTAKKYIGTKYVWGGNSLTKGIDCSGLVKYVFQANGINTARNSRSLYSENKKIKYEDLKAGDLVFYGDTKSKYINHVAIYIGNGQIIHSSTNYNGVAISSMNFSKTKNYGILGYARVIND